MKKIFLWSSLVFGAILILSYLFFIYLPSLGKEPEGASALEANLEEVEKEIGFLPIVSPSQTVFLPEIPETPELELQREEVAEKLKEFLEQQKAEARRYKRYKTPLPPLALEQIPNLGPKVIEINLSAQKLIRWENGGKLDENLVSTGKRGYATPVGLFNIRNKIDLAYSRKYRLYMPYWMAFTALGHGIHELPIFRNGKREGESHLGRPVSHGCVRLGVGPAEMVYRWAEIGTPVVVHY